MAKFEVVSRFDNANLILPARATKCSAGYDFQAAEEKIIPPYERLVYDMKHEWDRNPIAAPELTMAQMATLTKSTDARPVLVSTGMKVKLADDEYLEIMARSSLPHKHWLVMANAVGIVDADYYNNPNNEGEIFFQLINFSPIPIIIQKGDYIGQGIIKKYIKTEDDVAEKERIGGFGSSH